MRIYIECNLQKVVEFYWASSQQQGNHLTVRMPSAAKILAGSEIWFFVLSAKNAACVSDSLFANLFWSNYFDRLSLNCSRRRFGSDGSVSFFRPVL